MNQVNSIFNVLKKCFKIFNTNLGQCVIRIEGQLKTLLKQFRSEATNYFQRITPKNDGWWSPSKGRKACPDNRLIFYLRSLTILSGGMFAQSAKQSEF
jgi:hypothetical protein